MASKFIKIFNDTVLKQTVLQGYELQRSNENLGKFSMGELAFTRDTGRLFVGNFSSQELNEDIRPIGGGILTGNKYIGMIDSRPLCHFNGNGTTGCLPLNYSEDTHDRDNENVFEDEVGLLLEKSRYRPINSQNQFVYGGDGWNKKPEYIQKYGVYSGDFMFDIYNNALVLFDKNIKLNTGVTVGKSSTETNEYNETITNNWKETEINSGTLIWDGEVESIKNIHGEDITNTSTIRTPITNINDPNGNISQHPVYGDGYVIMRILEPDGITIDYADKKFQDGEPVLDTDNSNIGAYSNWTHNILTVNYPLDKILENFDKTNFSKGSNGIELGSTFDSNGEEEDVSSVTLPNLIELEGTGWEKTKNENGEIIDKRIRFRSLKEYNNTNHVEDDAHNNPYYDIESEMENDENTNQPSDNPFDEIIEEKEDKNACFLTINKTGLIQYKSPLSVATTSDVEDLRKEFRIRHHNIEVGNGLGLTNKDDPSSTSTIMTLGVDDSNWLIELKPDEQAIEQMTNGVNPWGFNNPGSYNYAGVCGYDNGVLKTTNEYEWEYQYEHTFVDIFDEETNEFKTEISGKKERDEFYNAITDKYEFNTLVSVNYLKDPYKLHENTSTEEINTKLQFFNLPYICCSNSNTAKGVITCPYTQKIDNPTEKNVYNKYESEIINADNGNKTIQTIITKSKETQYYEKTTYEADQIHTKIPNHASVAILQVIHESGVKICTKQDFEKLDNTSRCILDVEGRGCHVVEVPLYKSSIISESTLVGQKTFQDKDSTPSLEEIPKLEEEYNNSILNNREYFDKVEGAEEITEQTKVFHYDITSNGPFTISLLGYRV